MKAATSLVRKNGEKEEQSLADLNSAHAICKQNVSEYELFTLKWVKCFSLFWPHNKQIISQA